MDVIILQFSKWKIGFLFYFIIYVYACSILFEFHGKKFITIRTKEFVFVTIYQKYDHF